MVELGLSSGTSDPVATFKQTILGGIVTVHILESRALLKVRDLGEITTEEEVVSSARSVLCASSEIRSSSQRQMRVDKRWKSSRCEPKTRLSSYRKGT